MGEAMAIAGKPTLEALESQVDALRMEATQRLARESREGFGQFFTPLPTAHLMAGIFGPLPDEVSLLDPGA